MRLISVSWRPKIGWAEGCCQASGVPKSRSPLRRKFCWGAPVLSNALQSEQVRLRRATHRRGRFVLHRCTSNAQPVFYFFSFCVYFLFYIHTPFNLVACIFFGGIFFLQIRERKRAQHRGRARPPRRRHEVKQVCTNETTPNNFFSIEPFLHFFSTSLRFPYPLYHSFVHVDAMR